MKKTSYYLIPLLALIVFAGCLRKSEPEKKTRYSEKMARTSEDSTAILNLTTQYLDLLKGEQFDEALQMLYNYNEEDGTVQPIDEERRSSLRNSYANFPVLNYEIDTVLLYSEIDTEVRFKYEFFEKPEGSPIPNIVRGNVCPHRIEGKWYLTVPAEKDEEYD